MIDETKLREAFKKLSDDVMELRSMNLRMQGEIVTLRGKIDGYRTLLVDLRGKDAVDLHGSLGKEYDGIPVVMPEKEATEKQNDNMESSL